jgi:hypothetical protein
MPLASIGAGSMTDELYHAKPRFAEVYRTETLPIVVVIATATIAATYLETVCSDFTMMAKMLAKRNESGN